MKHTVLSFLVMLSLVPLMVAEPTSADEPLPAKENFHLYLLVGQSNMAGRGKITKADQRPIPRVLMLTKDRQWRPAIAPVHFDKSIAGVGIARSFAKQMVDADPKISVGLIPCAVGGSPISAWQPGAYYRPTNSHPYDDAIARTKFALKDGTLKGILWHQGEADCRPELAEIYEAKLHQLIERFRTEFNAPDVPFIAGQLGQFPERPWNDAKKTVDRAHRDLPNKVQQTAFVGSDGLTSRKDYVHFNAESYREFGKRYAQAMLKLQRSAK